MARIYVSSTFKDLEECRENVRLVLRQMNHEDVAMEYYVAEDRRPVDKCLDDVAVCDLYVGIFAWRYGYTPPGYDKSITELEYRKAVETEKKCHIFLLHEDALWPPKFVDISDDAEKIRHLRQELSEKYNVSFFKTPEELGSLVGSSVHNWEKEFGLVSVNKDAIPEIDIESYTKAIERKYKTLDLDTLTPSQKEDYLKVLLSNVFVEQNVREKTPPMELPKEVWRKIQEEWDIDTECLPEGLTIDDIKQANVSYYSKTPIPVLDAITDNKNKYLVILGDPGSGKSTLARYVLLSILDIHQDARLNDRFNGYLPLLIELREFIGLCSENKCKTFLDNFHHLGETQGYHLTREGIHRYLKENANALVIFDGLDEVFDPKEWENINHMIAGFALDYPKVRIIVTSRIVGYKPNILSDAGFHHFTIQEFEEEQIKVFLDKWYSIALYENQEEIKEKKERIIKSLEESPSIRQLAGNPLLLTILTIIGKHQELPRERWKLYDHAASVLVEHWDVNRHLEDSRVNADFIGEEDKKELLRRIAFNMQSAPEGLAGNFIHKDVLRNEIEEYFKDRYKTEPEKATIIARSMIDQFRKRNFILCLYGADFFGFIHRTFLEYFCADAIVEKFSYHEIDIDDLKKDYYEKYWEDQTWHEVLRLICGIMEKLAGDLIRNLMDVYHPQWFGKRPPWNIALAIKCLSEIRNPEAIDDTAKKLLLNVIRLFEMVHWTKDIDTFLAEEIVPAAKMVGSNWPHRDLIADSFSRTDIYYNTQGDIDLGLTGTWVDFISIVGSNSDEVYKIINKKLDGNNNSRLLAVLVLVAGWHDDPETLPLLKDRAVNDENNVVRYASVKAIALGWHDDPETLSLLKDWAVNDEKYDVQYASIQAIAQGWHDDPETLPLLKDRVVNDEDFYVRYASVQAIAQGWHDDPETLPLLKDQVVNDEDFFVRYASVEAIAQGWHDDPETLPLLKDWAVNDEKYDVQYASIQAIAQGWHYDPETLLLLKDWAVNDENYVVRSAAVQAIAQGWHDDPETLLLLKDRAVNDENYAVRHASVEAIAQGWHDDPETLPLLKDRVVNDEDNDVRSAAVEAIAQSWHDDPETLPLLKDRAVNDKDNDVQYAAVEAIAQGWHDDPKIISWLKKIENEQERTSPLRIFLCHSSGDKPEVRNLYQRLSSDGFDPWLDEEDLLPGQKWKVEIPKAVKTSDVVIICLSHKAINKSGYVQKEIKFALDKAEEQPENTISLIPLKLEECDVPERLQSWQWVNLFEEKGYGRLMNSLRSCAEKITPGSDPEPNLIQRHEEVTYVEENETFIDTIDMEFVLIQPGEFDMGSPTNETGRYDDEGPIHHVTISEAFYLSKYEVTQKQWHEIMGDNPSHFKGDDLPVENISWDDVQKFIKKLNKKEDTHKYRLPSEAEWEYAARAGTTTRYSFGDDDSKLGKYAWYSKNSGGKTHPVGNKGANPWGLYDVHGNVWEWVQDEWHDTYNGAPIDGSPWRDGVSTSQVYCGGSWFNSARSCRSAGRRYRAPGFRYRTLGFRLLQEV